MSLVDCFPIGAVDMIDGDKIDTKIIAVPFGDPTYNIYKDIKDMPPHIIDELIHFLKVYKQLEKKTTKISSFYGVEYAKNAIEKCMKNYENNH